MRLSQSGETWERVSGGQLARFKLAGLFASSLQKEALVTQAQRAPEAWERQENGAPDYKPDKVKSTLCPIS